ncbi:MAG: shikimate dehydrogenase [Bacteroidales bacterium]|nr:shikimate dehydrogenase [Bacteroidales bacterium]
MYGLLGRKLGHSFSKEYFTDKFAKLNLNDSYVNIELDDVSEIVSFVKENKDLKGFNVTVPYKEAIIPYLDDIDNVAKEVGAVNTVKVYNNGMLKGFNTDVIGFEKLLESTRQQDNKTKSLIFGSGGASKAVQYVLRKNNIPFRIVSRNVDLGIKISYDEINSTGFSLYSLVINTTPVGMFPNVNEYLELPYSTITSQNIFIDLIYNPAETLFLEKARLKGAAVFNGLTMLYEQAEAAWKIWGN